jgi:hypothetical protein
MFSTHLPHQFQDDFALHLAIDFSAKLFTR